MDILGHTMSAKHKVRELAMQLLFVWDANGACDLESAPQVIQQRGEDGQINQKAISMAQAVWEARPLADACVERLAPQWPIRRLAAVDRAVLRMAIWELTSSDTPPKVVIDEAIELAKEYSTELSSGFVNGVLDAALKEKQTITAETSETPQPETPQTPPAETTPQ